jgi:hypothetical protein
MRAAAARSAWRQSGLGSPRNDSAHRTKASGETQRTLRANFSDQVIRENPANRGTETSAEVLVGPPWRMESNAGQQQRY